jgi:ribosomal-protein-alanine N-acetyltransferase
MTVSQRIQRRVVLRAPTPEDESRFIALMARSKRLHTPWATGPTTADAFQIYLGRMAIPTNAALLVCLRTTGDIVGVINITNIVRGLFQSAYVGYFVFAGYERQGLMREGLQAAVQHAFKKMKLHRLEANIQPDNVASLALAKSCGFSKEGYSPRYLKIRGKWKDHERWAVTA